MTGSCNVGYVIGEIDDLVAELLDEGLSDEEIDLALLEYMAITKDLRYAGDI